MNALLTRSCLVAIILAFLFVGCGKSAPPAITEELKDEVIETGGFTARDVELAFFESGTMGEGPRKPTFRLKAPTISSENGGVALLSDVHAEIFDKNVRVAEMDAAQAGYSEETKQATLSGGVVFRMGTMTMELQSVEWINDEQTLRSDSELTLTDGETKLSASSMKFLSADKKLIMTNVSGMFHRAQGVKQ